MPSKKTTQTEPAQDDSIHANMRFYGKVQDTPKEAQKSFNNGRFSGTDINPMWRIKKLTEVFGPCGFGWWTQNVKYNFVNSEQTNEVAVFCELELVVVDPETDLASHPIYGVGGNTFVAQRKSGPQSSDEAMKMAYTDALSIACKALGFSHDIYYQADRTKYTAADIGETPKTAQKEASAEDIKTIIGRIQNGISAITKDMDDVTKNRFVQNVIIKHIGNEKYAECKDYSKLSALFDELNIIYKKMKAA